MTTALLLLLALARAADPAPAPPTDPGVAAIRAEVERLAAGLSLPDAAPPWLVRAELVSLDHDARAWGGRGALFAHVDVPRRELVHEVRVGSPALDNANFGSVWEEDGLGRTTLVASLDPDAVRRDVWRVVDDAWKDAWATLARREAARRRQARDDQPACYAPGEVATGRVPDPARAPWDGDALDAYVRTASAGYRDARWVLGAVDLRAQQGRRTVLDTRGTQVGEPIDRAWVTVNLSTRAPDGQFVGTTRTVAAASVAGLPAADALAADVRRTAERLTAWRALPAQTEPWAGPVIFEGDAAARLFHDLLLPRLQGTPQREPEERSGGRGFVILGGGARGEPPEPLAPQRRALPEGWSVRDDPSPVAGVGWTWDDEGVPGRAVTLVEDGVVHAHLTSRTPSRWFTGSNGHAVQEWNGVARGSPSHVTIAAPRALSTARLVKRGLQLARQVDLDHVLVVRSLGDRDPEGPFDDAPVGGPAEIVRRYADGHEEPVRGWAWGGLDARTLRDVVAAGPSATLDLAIGSGLRRVTAPAVLIEEIELVPIEPGDRFEPRVPPPGGR